MANDLYDAMKKIALAGVGAAAISAEKAKELVDKLVDRGEITVEQGKVMNEKLKHDVNEKVKEHVTVTDINKDTVIDSLKDMSSDDIAAIKARIAELEKKED